jgi:hypothetical protein
MVTALAVSAASAGLSVYGQQQQQKAQVKYQNSLQEANQKQMEQNRDLATRAYLDQASAANNQLAQSREAAAAANFDQSRETLQARGAAIASAAEAGVYGGSLDALLSDFGRHEGMFASRNEANLIYKQQQTAAQIKGYHTEATGRAAGIQPYQPSPVAPVDYFGPALQVVQTGVNTGLNYKAAASKGANSSTVVNNYYGKNN